jgi:hypothetical protein
MANLFFTGFNGSTVVADFLDTGTGTISGTYGRFGNGLGNGHSYSKVLPAAYAGVVYFGGAFKFPLLGAEAVFATIKDSAANAHWCMTVDASGVIRIRLGESTGGSLLATSAAGAWVSDAFQYLEFASKVHDSLGVAEIRVGGIVVATFAGDTRNGGNAETYRFSFNPGANWTINGFDDFYINDDQGSAPHNTYYGDVRADQAPLSADSAVDFVPLSSTNVSNVDDATPDDDTTYNASSTPGDVDLFTLSGYSAGAGVILGVRTRVKAKKTDAGARTFRSKISSGGTPSNGATAGLATSYAWHEQYDYVDPDTGVAWANSAAINATLVGYEVVA